MMDLRRDTNKTRFTVLALVAGAVLLFAVNILSNNVFKSMRIDLTEAKLYTTTEATKNILKSLKEPIDVRLFYSRILGERSPGHATYFARLKELLEQYADLSGGMVKLSILHPEPFSDIEDRAVEFGLKGVPVTSSGDLGYLGLAATNSTDDQAVIEFFNRERETFIEYDLTKLIYTLANPKKPVVGLLSTIPITGGPGNPMMGGRPTPAWRVMDQIKEFFEVNDLGQEIESVPDTIDLLMLVHPWGLTDKTLYAIDQFVMAGGRVLAFVDPNPETAQAALAMGRPMPPMPSSDLDRLFKSWGVNLVKDKVAGDLETGQRVDAGRDGSSVIVDYVVWLALGEKNFDTKDVVTGDIGRINMASAGILEKIEGATTTFTPLISTGTKSMRVDLNKVRVNPDPQAIFREFKEDGQTKVLAARITGKVKSAFPDGPPKDKEPAKEEGKAKDNDKDGAKDAGKDKPKKPHLAQSDKPLNAIVVADSDMLADRFWLNIQDFFGQQVVIPIANNAAFTVNALDNLGGNEALIGLRGRSGSARPFYLVENIRRDAEKRYRLKEEALTKKLGDLQTKLVEIQGKEGSGKGAMMLTAEDKVFLEQIRGEMLSVRKELRDVQLALRQDIEKLDALLKFINIAGIPLLLSIGVLGVVFFRRRRSRQVAAAA
ncbi:MAG: Gldg family protein [Rhodospirillales bacterium]|nr:Gldg family protein [Rhodospirillales bacterium]